MLLRAEGPHVTNGRPGDDERDLPPSVALAAASSPVVPTVYPLPRLSSGGTATDLAGYIRAQGVGGGVGVGVSRMSACPRTTSSA